MFYCPLQNGLIFTKSIPTHRDDKKVDVNFLALSSENDVWDCTVNFDIALQQIISKQNNRFN